MNETRFIGHVPTPWSSWMLAASPTTTTIHAAALKSFLARLTASVGAFDSAAARETTSKTFILKTFGYEVEDVESWLAAVTYPKSGIEQIERSTIEKTLTSVSFFARTSYLASISRHCVLICVIPRIGH